MTKFVGKFLSLAVVAAAALFCAEAAHAKEIVVLVDYSASITDEDWKTYDRTFQLAIDSLKGGDSISFAGISADQRASFRRLASLEVKKTDSRAEEIEQKKRTREFIGNYVTIRNRDKRQAPSTFILSATGGAGDLFRQSKQSEKWLILLSDMMDSSSDSGRMNFLTGPKCGYGDVIANLKKNHLVAALDGVKVFGAGIGGGGMNDRQYSCLQDFWNTYFQTAGAGAVNITRELKALQ